MAGLSRLQGALDVNGEELRQDAQDASSRFLTARTVPMMTVPPSSTLRVPSSLPANLIGSTSSCRPLKEQHGKALSGGAASYDLQPHYDRSLLPSRELLAEPCLGVIRT